MAGHSKWANIKHRKAAQDKKRGKAFSQISKAIMAAVRGGGPNPNDNITLRLHMDKARAANMPKDTVERAIKRASGEAGGEQLQELTYEGYGPGGVGILIQTITDNVNRTNSEVRSTMEKRGGSMGKPGSVSWNFEQKAVYVLDAEGVDEDALMETALDAGADDLEGEAGFFTVTGAPDTFASIGRALTDAGYTVENADVTFIPKEKIMLAPDDAKKLINIIDAVEELDDVSNAITNGDIPDEVLAELGG
ncbi:MAG: YebC/PmpR family DNA-binding transcriptional regulator [Planctomycetota bacterium]|jgi:YebC/PmpR family DNA-binding regulatory protein